MFTLASFSLLLMLLLGPSVPADTSGEMVNMPLKLPVNPADACRQIYCDCGLEGILDYGIYLRALAGASMISAPKKDILTIIDYSKPSYEKRFYVIDLKDRKLLYHTLVSHGKNSGEIECSRFSNQPRSLQSCPGFFLTAESYTGRQGYSLRLDGLEPGVNDLARARAIVIHGAEYVCQRYVEDFGYIGRSWGCPALPLELNRNIIDFIKGGSCLYIHTDSESYLSHSILPAQRIN
jgi:hypothetical protein